MTSNTTATSRKEFNSEKNGSKIPVPVWYYSNSNNRDGVKLLDNDKKLDCAKLEGREGQKQYNGSYSNILQGQEKISHLKCSKKGFGNKANKRLLPQRSVHFSPFKSVRVLSAHDNTNSRKVIEKQNNDAAGVLASENVISILEPEIVLPGMQQGVSQSLSEKSGANKENDDGMLVCSHVDRYKSPVSPSFGPSESHPKFRKRRKLPILPTQTKNDVNVMKTNIVKLGYCDIGECQEFNNISSEVNKNERQPGLSDPAEGSYHETSNNDYVFNDTSVSENCFNDEVEDNSELANGHSIPCSSDRKPNENFYANRHETNNVSKTNRNDFFSEDATSLPRMITDDTSCHRFPPEPVSAKSESKNDFQVSFSSFGSYDSGGNSFDTDYFGGPLIPEKLYVSSEGSEVSFVASSCSCYECRADTVNEQLQRHIKATKKVQEDSFTAVKLYKEEIHKARLKEQAYERERQLLLNGTNLLKGGQCDENDMFCKKSLSDVRRKYKKSNQVSAFPKEVLQEIDSYAESQTAMLKMALKNIIPLGISDHVVKFSEGDFDTKRKDLDKVRHKRKRRKCDGPFKESIKIKESRKGIADNCNVENKGQDTELNVLHNSHCDSFTQTLESSFCEDGSMSKQVIQSSIVCTDSNISKNENKREPAENEVVIIQNGCVRVSKLEQRLQTPVECDGIKAKCKTVKVTEQNKEMILSLDKVRVCT